MTVMAEAGIGEYRQELTAHPQDLKVLRRIVRAHLRYWGFDQLVEAATLGVHELLSNVDKHTGSAEIGGARRVNEMRSRHRRPRRHAKGLLGRGHRLPRRDRAIPEGVPIRWCAR
jgi:hypothetical protein